LKSMIDDLPYLQIKHYRIYRSEVEEDIEFLKSSEERFYQDVINRTRPALLLPDF